MRSLKKNKKGLIKTVGMLVAFFIVIGIGLMIYAEVDSSYTIDDTSLDSAKNNTTAMVATVFNMLPLIGLVIVASIILGILISGIAGGKGTKL